MEWLNYHHLLYFWAVARHGSIAAASAELGLAGPTISAQIRKLEDTLGSKLLQRSGRRLVVTDTGRSVLPFAEQIFSLGRQVCDVVKGHTNEHPLRLSVGVIDVLPKWVVYRLLQPALRMPKGVQLICREDRPERLLAELAVHELDIVLTDSASVPAHVQCFSHLLGESAVAFYGTSKLVAACRQGFPRSISRCPVLLPSDRYATRRGLDHWFQSHHVEPHVVGKFDDFALMATFATDGAGIMAAPVVIEERLRLFGLQRIAIVNSVREHFYAISVDRRIKHPAVVAICEAGRRNIFRKARHAHTGR